MQIACNRFGCQKSVEVCYWACKYRRDCKDWHSALDSVPGTEAITERLTAAAKKSGRNFDQQTLILTSRKKKNRASIISKSSSAHLKSADFSSSRGKSEPAKRTRRGEQVPRKSDKTNYREVKDKMTEEILDSPIKENVAASEHAETTGKPAAAKVKAKPAAKPKPVSQNTGPVFLLLYPNGKYKELREAELNSEAAGVLKDSSLRLVKGQQLIPQISFKTAEE